MRDLIWTIIAIWLLYKIVDVFKNFSKQKSNPPGRTRHDASGQQTPSDQDMKSALKKHLNKEGEYIDFEEINDQ